MAYNGACNAHVPGSGSVAEAIVTATIGYAFGTGLTLTAGTLTLASGSILRISNIISTYAGAGILRLRQTNLAGVIIAQIRFAAAGTIIVDRMSNPILINGGVVVVTEEGNFANSMTIVGKISNSGVAA